MIGLEFHGSARQTIVVCFSEEDVAAFERGFVGKIVLCSGKPIHFQRVPRASHESSCEEGDHFCIRLGTEAIARLRAGRVATIPTDELVLGLVYNPSDAEALSTARAWAKRFGVPLNMAVRPSLEGAPS